MARPTKNEHEKRAASLPTVRVTTAERVLIEDKAAAAGLSLTDFVRVLTLHEEVKTRQTKLEASLLVELNKLGVELSRQGNNLNQLAHGLNVDRQPKPLVLQAALDDHQATMSKLMSLMEKLDAAL